MASSTRLRVTSPQMQRSPDEQGTLRRRSQRSPTKAATGSKDLLAFEDLPHWHQDNEYILHGYRPISGSARVSFGSLSYIHNESVNIYSHLIPAVAFLLGEWYIQQYLTSKYPNVTVADGFIFAFFLLTATTCLGLSTTYHTLMNHSHEIEQLWLRLDLIGIVVLTIGDFVSGIYMVFWCEPVQRKVYWSMIGVLGLLTIFIMISPRFRGPEFRTFRALTFVATGLSGFAPLIHGIKMFGLSQMMIQSGMPYYLIEGAFLLMGALVYATKFPESRFPGRFDIYGSSHQLFHILVVFAAVTQLVGILSAFDYNHLHRTCS